MPKTVAHDPIEARHRAHLLDRQLQQGVNGFLALEAVVAALSTHDLANDRVALLLAWFELDQDLVLIGMGDAIEQLGADHGLDRHGRGFTVGHVAPAVKHQFQHLD